MVVGAVPPSLRLGKIDGSTDAESPFADFAASPDA